LASSIPDEQIEHNIDKIEKNSNTIFLSAVSEEEVMDIVQKSKNNYSMDCYSVNMALLKKVINNIKAPLTHICNLSLQNGCVPKKMKIAKVIPLFKNGNKHIFTNYRPISLLPQFSKILEKIFNIRLEKIR